MNVSSYFSKHELECKCGCGVAEMDLEFLKILDQLRDDWGKPIILNSAYRCPDHNAAVSSTKSRTGPHTTGKAADLRVSRKDCYEVMKLAFMLNFTGIGVAQKGSDRFLHLDTLTPMDSGIRPTVWSY